MMINRSTYIKDDSVFGGSVEVTVNGKTRRLPASVYPDRDQITAYKIAVRYPTGTKVWSGRVTQFATGKEAISGGFDNRATRSRISSVVGFMDDISEKHHSQR